VAASADHFIRDGLCHQCLAGSKNTQLGAVANGARCMRCGSQAVRYCEGPAFRPSLKQLQPPRLHAEADAPRSRCVLDPGGERVANARIMGWPPLSRCRALRGYRADPERGLFDMIFFGDGSGIPYTWEGGIDAAMRRGVAWPRLLSRAPMRLSGEPGAAFSAAIFSSRLTAADLDANADALPAPAITPGIGPRRIGDMTNVRRFNRRRGWLVLAAAGRRTDAVVPVRWIRTIGTA
jgi:hypothetical protein